MTAMINQEKLTMCNFTQVENVIFDKLMAVLSPSEFKVYMAIYRKTIGWGDVVDCISTSQIMKLTGLSNRVVIQSVKSLKEKSLIFIEVGLRGINKITLNLKSLHSNANYDEKSQVTKSNNPPMTNSHSTYDEKSQVTYDEKSHTKETINKLTKEVEQPPQTLENPKTSDTEKNTVTDEMVTQAIDYLTMQGLLNSFEPVNREEIRFEIIQSQQYKSENNSNKPVVGILASYLRRIPVADRMARFQTLPQAEIVHPSHITASAPVVQENTMTREEKLARIAMIERGELS